MTELLATRDVLSDGSELHARVLALETVPGGVESARFARAGPVPRVEEPVSLPLWLFLSRRIAAVFPDEVDDSAAASIASLDLLLAVGQPWPADLALLLLRRIAALLDAADAVGAGPHAFTPGCIVLDGPHLVLVRDPASVDPAYVDPAAGDSATYADGARAHVGAGQYGLALLAATLLCDPLHGSRVASVLRRVRRSAESAVPRPNAARLAALLGGFSPAVQRVLLSARDPDPMSRFSSARAFVLALDAAWRVWSRVGGERRSAATHRVAAASAGIVIAVLTGSGLARYAAQRDTPRENETVGAPAIDRVGPAEAPAVPVRNLAPPIAVPPSPVVAAVAVGRPTPPAALPVAVPVAVPTVAGALGGRGTRDSVSTHAGTRRPLPAATTTIVAHRLRALARLVVPHDDSSTGARVRLSPALASPTTDFARAPGLVDTPVARAAAALVGTDQPRYPSALYEAKIDGEVVARFVVDSTGHVDPATFEVVRSTDTAFTEAVRESLRRLRFLPADRGGHPVASTVEQTFRFAPRR